MAAAALLLLALVATPEGAYAHAEYERSEPADNAVLGQAPERVDIWFAQEMARTGGLPAVTVVNQAGDVIADEPVLDDDDRKHLSIELPPDLPPRRYTVIWRNVSDEDGEEAQGAFHFFVGPDPEPTGSTPTGINDPTTRPTAVAPVGGGSNDGDGAPWWLAAVAAVAGLAVGVGGGLSASRFRQTQ